MISVHRSLIIALAERYALIAMSLVSYAIIARLLTPAEIGLYSIATALIGMAQVVRDFGVGSFLIQERNLSDPHIRSALGVSILIGATFFLIFMLGGGVAGNFYNDARITEIIRIVAFNFLLLPLCSISIALLRREMLFGRIMTTNLSAAIAGMAVIVTLAFLGAGPKSLAWGSLVANGTTGLVAWLCRKDRRVLRPSISHWRAIVRFGGQSTFANIITAAAIDINDLVVGKVIGFAPLAILSRGQGLMNLFHRDIMAAVRGVAYPAFARAFRAGEPMDNQYILSVANVTVFAWPFYGMAALYPLEILRLLFGPQWDAAAKLVPIFCLAGAVSATYSLIIPWIMASGRIDLVTRAELTVQPIRILIIVAATVIFKSILACAIAFLTVFVLAAPVFYAFKSRCGPTGYRRLAVAMSKSAGVTVVCLSIPAGSAIYFGIGRSQPINLLIPIGMSFLCGMLWIIAVGWLRHPVSATPTYRRALSLLLLRCDRR